MNLARLRMDEVICWERPVKLRLPFRFGVITLHEAPQLFVRVGLSDAQGRRAQGYAAEMLIPKWFDKRPELSAEQNIEQLRRSVRRAATAGVALVAQASAWRLHLDVEQACVSQAEGDEPGLVTHFGPALLQRAVLDGLAQLHQVGWSTLLRSNLMGMEALGLPADLQAWDVSGWLAAREPMHGIHARHTVGLADQLLLGRGSDGELPSTLEGVAQRWQHRYYKLKLQGNLHDDVQRLVDIAQVLDQARPDWLCTLDGNEQYGDVSQCEELLAMIEQRAELRSVKRALMYVEQPLHRAVAMQRPLPDMGWPIMIDESDDSVESFPRALALGYQGVSSKGCKGLYKSLINRMRCDAWAPQARGLFVSGEDLTIQPGIALHQDLALASFIGLLHVERNGHYYGDGMAQASDEERAMFCQNHDDLYLADGSRVDLRLDRGVLNFGSLSGVGFAGHTKPHLHPEDATLSISRN
jgi:hypothetical protein